MITLEEAVLRKLKTSQHILSSVESCTGGLISHLLTNISGSSEAFWGSHVVYDNSAKIALGVEPHLIEEHGAVSSQVSLALAQAGLQNLSLNIEKHGSSTLLQPKGLVCVSTTGIAGPSGGSALKPVGLCYITVAISDREPQTIAFQANVTQRVDIKKQFAHQALELIRESF